MNGQPGNLHHGQPFQVQSHPASNLRRCSTPRMQPPRAAIGPSFPSWRTVCLDLRTAAEMSSMSDNRSYVLGRPALSKVRIGRPPPRRTSRPVRSRGIAPVSRLCWIFRRGGFVPLGPPRSGQADSTGADAVDGIGPTSRALHADFPRVSWILHSTRRRPSGPLTGGIIGAADACKTGPGALKYPGLTRRVTLF